MAKEQERKVELPGKDSQLWHCSRSTIYTINNPTQLLSQTINNYIFYSWMHPFPSNLEVNLLSKINGSIGSGAASTRAQYRTRTRQGVYIASHMEAETTHAQLSASCHGEPTSYDGSLVSVSVFFSFLSVLRARKGVWAAPQVWPNRKRKQVQQGQRSKVTGSPAPLSPSQGSTLRGSPG